jgi:acyl dehydratase
MPGTLPLWVSDRWVLHRPAFEGETIAATSELVDVGERPGRDGSRSVTYSDRTSYVGSDGSVIGERYAAMVRRERPRQPATAPAEPVQTHYSGEERRAIGAQYEREGSQRRGSTPLRGSELGVGDPIPPIVKGPLTVTNVVGWLLGWGSPLCPTNRIAHLYLQEHPRAGLEDPRSNIQDTIEGPHWDAYLAQASGMPQSYDFGTQRISWVAHLLTDWCGDDGFLTELEVRLRRPNFVGDTTWLKGQVTALVPDSDSVLVDCAVTGTNQRGEETTTGTAKVRLPR